MKRGKHIHKILTWTAELLQKNQHLWKMKLHWFIVLLIFLACSKDNEVPEIRTDLATYISDNEDFPLVKDSLIACALGGDNVLLTDAENPISILFYPKGNASDFLYFETENIDADPLDYTNYEPQDLPLSDIFNGYLRKFERQSASENKWGLVTYVRDGEIHISNPIRLKLDDKPTEDNPDLLNIDQSESLAPLFEWTQGVVKENVIYFHVILDNTGDLLTGTYTLEPKFKFYDLSNVVLNIRDINPPPVLTSRERYTFVLMGVSVDNWVNLILEKEFIAK